MNKRETYRVPLGRGAVLKILLSQKPDGSFGSFGNISDNRGRSNQLWPIDQSSDEFARRVEKGGITFYDLGQYLDGDHYSDRYLAIDISTSPPSESALKTFVNNPLTDPVSNWKNIYRRITRPELKKYQFSLKLNNGSNFVVIDDANPKVNAQGQLMLDDNMTVMNLRPQGRTDKYVFYEKGGLFPDFDTANSNIKITAEPSYTAAAVPLVISKDSNADCFINLALFSVYNQLGHYYNAGENTVDGSDIPPSEAAFVSNSQAYPYPFADIVSSSSQEYGPATEKIKTTMVNASTDTIRSKLLNWRRGDVLGLFDEKTDQAAADQQMSIVLKNYYGAEISNLTYSNYQTVTYLAAYKYPNSGHPVVYPLFRGSWRGFTEPPSPLPRQAPGPTSGTMTTTALSSFDGEMFPLFYNYYGGMLRAVIVQGANRFFIWYKTGSGGGGL